MPGSPSRPAAGPRRSCCSRAADYLAGPPREAYFGLGDATVADAVRIAWADGTTTELHDVPADQVLRVAHG